MEALYQRTLKSNEPREKIELIEEQLDVLTRFYHEKEGALKKRVERMKLDPEKAGELYNEELLKLLQKIKNHSNKMIAESEKLLREAGLPVKIKTKQMAEDVEYNYLELQGNGSEDLTNAAKKIERFKKRFDTETVTFDLYQNAINSSAGFSVAEKKWIDLGVRGMRNLLLDDIITMVGKHEFFHAAFGAKRAKDVSSIYHTSYMAVGEQALSKAGSGYDRFMSAEEVYNWANNSFWASTRLKDISKFKPSDYLYDLSAIHNYLDGTKSLALQTEEIVADTLDGLKLMRQEIDAGEFNLITLTKEDGMAIEAQEVFNIVLHNPKTDVLIKEFAGPEYREAIQKIMARRLKIQAAVTQEGLDSGSKMSDQKIVEEMFRRENEQSKEELLSLLKTFEQKQIVLGKVAKAMKDETDAVVGKTEEFIERLKKSLEINKDALKDPSWAEEFRALVQEYRKLGNLVKEDYKGFAGN